jgi:signal transduction histidine kinase
VRAIAEVATAVTKGDLTRSIRVEALGEVAVLKDNINEMIRNLRDTTQKNSDQDWLKTNLAKFTRMLQGQKDLIAVSRMILSELAPLVSAQHGVFYLMDAAGEESQLRLLASYAFRERKHLANRLSVGEGIVGQCALEKEAILLTDVPPDYVQISSGLGEAAPRNIIVLPVVFEGHVKAVIELASFQRFSETHQTFLDQLTESIGIVLNTIEANMRTEELLKQSQSLAVELQSRQQELTQTNQELEEKARLLFEQNAEVERKNREVELAKQELEEKASQLTLTSKYKSEFLANMSHELRTPLNAIIGFTGTLLMSLAGPLTEEQARQLRTIQSSARHLLSLINDLLDLAKIESGKVEVHLEPVQCAGVIEEVVTSMRPLAESKGLSIEIKAPRKDIAATTDRRALHQILLNLTNNAIKFTDKGKVEIGLEQSRQDGQRLVMINVMDTGVGIRPDDQAKLFQAFSQVDSTSARRYEGTGLGLHVSQKLAHLLGAQITFESEHGKGSTFTLTLPEPLNGHIKWAPEYSSSRTIRPTLTS